MTLIPAHGKDYKNKKELVEDFKNDKDFVIADMFSGNMGAYVNKSDLLRGKINTVNIRYKNNTMVAVIKVK